MAGKQGAKQEATWGAHKQETRNSQTRNNTSRVKQEGRQTVHKTEQQKQKKGRKKTETKPNRRIKDQTPNYNKFSFIRFMKYIP